MPLSVELPPLSVASPWSHLVVLQSTQRYTTGVSQGLYQRREQHYCVERMEGGTLTLRAYAQVNLIVNEQCYCVGKREGGTLTLRACAQVNVIKLFCLSSIFICPHSNYSRAKSIYSCCHTHYSYSLPHYWSSIWCSSHCLHQQVAQAGT